MLELVAKETESATEPCACGGLRTVRWVAEGRFRSVGPCSRCDAARALEVAARQRRLQRQPRELDFGETRIPEAWWNAGMGRCVVLRASEQVNPLQVARGGTWIALTEAEDQTRRRLQGWVKDLLGEGSGENAPAVGGSAFVIGGRKCRGKSHLVAAAAADVARAGRRVLWLDLRELAGAIELRFSNRRFQEALELIDQALGADLVVLDGLEACSRSKRLQEQVGGLIAVRCRRRRALLATTRLEEAQLDERLGEEAFAQLQEMAHARGGAWEWWAEGEDHRLALRRPALTTPRKGGKGR